MKNEFPDQNLEELSGSWSTINVDYILDDPSGGFLMVQGRSVVFAGGGTNYHYHN
jgi:hypothetical protein